MPTYLQKAWTDSIDDVSINDVRIAIAETQQMDEEHAAFWVGTEEEEYILETDKNLDMIVVANGEATKYRAADWKEVEYLYQLLLDEDYTILINHVKKV
ncbi:MAG: hypothetical protein V4456_04015 [Bacteroidota bacterium]